MTGSNPSKFHGDPKRPVEQVSWDDAVEFCRRLSELPGEERAKRRYELPTEAQWEYGCRAGTTGRRCFGDDEKPLDEYGWFNANAGGQTHPVGQKRANVFGLCDMYGNVWEWCQDWYDRDYYATSPTDDPTGDAGGHSRVLRGGCWNNLAGFCRSALRYDCGPGYRFDGHGFRVCVNISKRDPPIAQPSSKLPEFRPASGPQPPLAVAPFSADEARKYQDRWAKYLHVPVVQLNSVGMKQHHSFG